MHNGAGILDSMPGCILRLGWEHTSGASLVCAGLVAHRIVTGLLSPCSGTELLLKFGNFERAAFGFLAQNSFR